MCYGIPHAQHLECLLLIASNFDNFDVLRSNVVHEDSGRYSSSIPLMKWSNEWHKCWTISWCSVYPPRMSIYYDVYMCITFGSPIIFNSGILLISVAIFITVSEMARDNSVYLKIRYAWCVTSSNRYSPWRTMLHWCPRCPLNRILLGSCRHPPTMLSRRRTSNYVTSLSCRG